MWVIKSKSMKKQLILFFWCYLLFSFNIYAQDNYKDEVELVTLDKVFFDGGFTSFFKGFNNQFTLSVVDIKNDTVFEIENPQLNTFVLENWFISANNTSSLFIFDKITKTMDTIADVNSFDLLRLKNQIIYTSKSDTITYLLDLKSGKVKSFGVIMNYKFSPNENELIYQDTTHQIRYLDLKSNKETLIKDNAPNLKNAIWSVNSKQVYFVDKIPEGLEIKVFEIGKGKLLNLLKVPLEGFEVNLNLKKISMYNNRWLALAVLDDDQIEIEAGPEVWLGTSNGITPKIKNRKFFMPQLLIIDLKNYKTQSFFEKEVVKRFIFDENSSFLLSYDPYEKEDFTKQYPDVEMEIHDLKKPTQTIKLPNISGTLDRLVMGYKNESLFYFKDKDWWFLDLNTNKTNNITKNLGGTFYKEYDEYCAIDCAPEGKLIITKDPNIVYLYDVFDIWKYNISKNKAIRLTNGREENKRYSLASCNFEAIDSPWQYTGSHILKSSNKYLIQGLDLNNFSESLAFLNRNEQVESIVEKLGHVSEVKYQGSVIIYKEEGYNFTPRVVYLNTESNKKKIIFQTYTNDSIVEQNKVELFTTNSSRGKGKSAIVRFPINYDPNKKYPAIVYVYEKKTPFIYRYQNVNDPSGSGFNYRSYINDDYFVIEPDIHYEIGNPGISASNSVNSILDELLHFYPIDPNRLGILGHSFGGYEVNYIITQTNRFKAAVSSAGISDPSSWYLTMNWNTMRPEFWRFEDQSFRIKDGLFEKPELYIVNSPIFHSAKIETPLLIWSGKKDFHVNWSQSVSMFLALKRQNKVVNLLLYPDEAHILSNFDNKVDATTKVKQWFDFYLKDNQKPKWLTE